MMARNHQPPAERKYHPPRYYAEISGQATDTIRRIIQTGELKAANLSDTARPKYLIHEDDWQSFVDSRSNVSSGSPKRKRRNVRDPFDTR